jgi:DNA-binding MarR family transcriptional regulator
MALRASRKNLLSDDSGEASRGLSRGLEWLEIMPHDRMSQFVKIARRCYSRSLQIRLIEHNVSIGYWVFFRVLWEADGISQQQVSERAGLRTPTTYVALKAMERLGYVKRVRKPGDRKTVYIYLTTKGRDLQGILDPIAKETNEIAVRGVSTDDLVATRRTLQRMIENLVEDEARYSASVQAMPSNQHVSRLAKRRKPKR